MRLAAWQLSRADPEEQLQVLVPYACVGTSAGPSPTLVVRGERFEVAAELPADWERGLGQLPPETPAVLLLANGTTGRPSCQLGVECLERGPGGVLLVEPTVGRGRQTYAKLLVRAQSGDVEETVQAWARCPLQPLVRFSADDAAVLRVSEFAVQGLAIPHAGAFTREGARVRLLYAPDPERPLDKVVLSQDSSAARRDLNDDVSM
ncbi:hypothetical protein OAX78_01260, partial [Planctomycetota bacterium]|nr:hypothetical protein [Planctomycetota bacterium]